MKKISKQYQVNLSELKHEISEFQEKSEVPRMSWKEPKKASNPEPNTRIMDSKSPLVLHMIDSVIKPIPTIELISKKKTVNMLPIINIPKIRS